MTNWQTWVYRRLKQWRLARLAAWWQRRTYRLDPRILVVSQSSPLDLREASTTWPMDSWTWLADTQTGLVNTQTGQANDSWFIYHI